MKNYSIALKLYLLVSVLLGMTMAKGAAAANNKVSAAVANETTNQTLVFNNAKLWVGLMFPVIAFLFAIKLSMDNQPDPQKDSILYARFLTQKVESRKMD